MGTKAEPPRTRVDTFTMATALNDALRQALAEDPSVVLMGEDIGQLGGVFRVTDGLLDTYGPQRVIDTPLAEAGMVGTAIGLALAGYRPVLEIQFDGFVFPALNQICTHLARMPARFGEPALLPVVIRVPTGGRIRAAELHSDSPEGYFAHTPDLRVIAASDPRTAKALLLAAVRSDQPCIFLEPKRLYRRARVPVREAVDEVDLGSARTVRPGRDVLVVSYGPAIDIALDAAASVAPDIDAGVVDLVSLAPLDIAHVLAELAANRGRLVVVAESIRRCSIASEVVSQVVTAGFGLLATAPRVLTAPDRPYPASALEDSYIPQAPDVARAIREVAHA